MPSRILGIIANKVRLLHEPPPKSQKQDNQQNKNTKQPTLVINSFGLDIGRKSAD